MEPLNDKGKQIKNEDKKAGEKLLVLVVIGGVFGGFLGFVTYITSDFFVLENVMWEEIITQGIIKAATCFYFVLNAISIPILIYKAIKNKKAVREWDGEAEEVVERIEKNINIDLLIINIHTILNAICYGIILYRFSHNIYFSLINHSILIVSFILFMIILTFVQKSNVNRMKELNPEKKGSVFDMNFNQKWIESCDEAERQTYAKVADKTLRIMNRIYLFVVVGILILGFNFEIGIFPLLLVSAMWLTQSSIYAFQSLKEKQKMPIIF